MVWSGFQGCGSKFVLLMLLAFVELLGCHDTVVRDCVTNTNEYHLHKQPEAHEVSRQRMHTEQVPQQAGKESLAMELVAQLPLMLEPTSRFQFEGATATLLPLAFVWALPPHAVPPKVCTVCKNALREPPMQDGPCKTSQRQHLLQRGNLHSGNCRLSLFSDLQSPRYPFRSVPETARRTRTIHW